MMVERLKGLFHTIGKGMSRYFITIIFLFILTIINWNNLRLDYSNTNTDWIMSLIIGIFISSTLQVLYERYFHKFSIRYILSGVSVAVVVISYFILNNSVQNTALSIRIGIVLFILFVGFLWIPTIGNRVRLPQSLLATFKAGLLAGVYAVVLFLGICAILAAVNGLITSVDSLVFVHTANIIFVLFMPISFLSFIPKYYEWDEREYQNMGIASNKFFDTLIAYILIPITVVFTAVLALYIISNITTSFWTENLLEQILVVYSIVVLMIYLIACCVNRPITKYFRKIFPYVLVLVVLIQTISSILKLSEVGVTYGRYYVILFGVFAFIAGMIFIFEKHTKIEWIAPILIVLALLSIIPPVDAFTNSKRSQVNRLEAVLQKNGMIIKNQILPKGNLDEEDKQIIIQSYQELNRMDELENTVWFKDKTPVNFDSVFGFNQYEEWKDNSIYNNYYLSQATPLSMKDYDFFVQSSINPSTLVQSIEYSKDNITYQLKRIQDEDFDQLELTDSKDNVLIVFDFKEIYDRVRSFPYSSGEMTVEEGTYTIENEYGKLMLLINNIHMEENKNMNVRLDFDANIFIGIK